LLRPMLRTMVLTQFARGSSLPKLSYWVSTQLARPERFRSFTLPVALRVSRTRPRTV
jgi:hypothetical protein